MTHVATVRTYWFGIKYSYDTRCYGEDILFDCILKYSHDTCCYGEDLLFDCILKYSHDTFCYGEDILVWHQIFK